MMKQFKRQHQAIENIKDEQRRKPNQAVYNIPESDKDKASERADEDLAECCDIENSLGLEVKLREIRQGEPKEEDKTRKRPVFVNLADEKYGKRLKKKKNDPVKKTVAICLTPY